MSWRGRKNTINKQQRQNRELNFVVQGDGTVSPELVSVTSNSCPSANGVHKPHSAPESTISPVPGHLIDLSVPTPRNPVRGKHLRQLEESMITGVEEAETRMQQPSEGKRYIMCQAKLSLETYLAVGQTQHVGRGSGYVRGFVRGISNDDIRRRLADTMMRKGWEWKHVEEKF